MKRLAPVGYAPGELRRGAPRSRPEPQPPGLGDLVGIATREVLEHFGKCPRCGYAAQVTETVKTYSTFRAERMLFHTCGLPCGWTMSASTVSETGSNA